MTARPEIWGTRPLWIRHEASGPIRSCVSIGLFLHTTHAVVCVMYGLCGTCRQLASIIGPYIRQFRATAGL